MHSTKSVFSGCFQIFFLIICFQELDYGVFGHLFVWVYCSGLCSASLVYRFKPFVQFGKFWAIISLRTFLLFPPFFPFPSTTLVTQIFHHLLYSHRSLNLCSFLPSLFSFCCAPWIISIRTSFHSLILSYPFNKVLFCFSVLISSQDSSL